VLKYETTSSFSFTILGENFVLNCAINILFDVFLFLQTWFLFLCGYTFYEEYQEIHYLEIVT